MLASSSTMRMIAHADHLGCAARLASRSRRRASGSVNEKVAPLTRRALAPTAGRRSGCMISRLIGSPSPVPCGLPGQRVADLAELLEDDLLVARPRCPGRCRATSTRSASGCIAQRDGDAAALRGRRTSRRSTSRLSITCTSRSRSARHRRHRGGSSSVERDAACPRTSRLVAATASSIELASGRPAARATRRRPTRASPGRAPG